MRESGSNAKGILAYLRKPSGKRRYLRDLQKMLQTIRSDKQGDASDATRAEYVLREFDSQEEGNSVTVYVDQDSKKAHVVLQSSRMGGCSVRFRMWCWWTQPTVPTQIGTSSSATLSLIFSER
ncbi:hypothetical protein JG687_00019442 [Phytophthora cactorum]|uniref:Uncharacterized protein n=1 Tax=Phytophthora cactorum TaxID=29920 RepID=A0A8T1TM44_9STRA|nr:hypothetical protein JG687_00019442 [Phytophthora cactorum]